MQIECNVTIMVASGERGGMEGGLNRSSSISWVGMMVR